MGNISKVELIYPLDYGICSRLSSVGSGESSNYNDNNYDYDKVSLFVKEDMPKEKVNFDVFGEEIGFFYISSLKETSLRTYCLDRFRGRNNKNETIHLTINSDTGKIVRYSDKNAGTDRNYQSKLGFDSTEKDFVDYAKYLMDNYTSINTDEWETEIKTKIISTNYDPKLNGKEIEGFVNYYQDDTEFSAEYTVSFYKTIAGIRRKDIVYVTFSNTGEIAAFYCESYDDVFLPFEKAIIDLQKINNIEKSEENNICRNHNVTSINSDHKLVAMSNELFVEITVSYEYEVKDGENTNQLGGMERYLIKVAEYSTN